MDESKDLLPATRPIFDPAYDPATAQPGADAHILNVLCPFMGVGLPQVAPGGAAPPLFAGVSDSLICPSDRSGKDSATNNEPIWRGLGWSYDYFPAELSVANEMLTIPASLRAVAITKTYEQIRWKDLPVNFDYDDLHPIRAKPQIPRNAVYFGDWRADWATDLTRYQNRSLRADQLWQELVCDLARFGGLRLPGCR